MQVQELEIASIHPNDYNPNKMDEEKLKVLRNNIEQKGFLQPIVVRKDKEGYVIVDGEHRWTVMKQLGKKTIPAVVTESSDLDAMVQTINMNGLRGNMDTIKLAKVVADIRKELTPEEIGNLMGYNEADLIKFEDVISLNSADLDAATEKEIIAETDAEAEAAQTVPGRVFNFSKQHYELVLRGLHRHGGGRDSAFIDICRQYLMRVNPALYAEAKARSAVAPSDDFIQPEEEDEEEVEQTPDIVQE